MTKLPKYPTNIEDCHKQLRSISQERDAALLAGERLRIAVVEANNRVQRVLVFGEKAQQALVKFKDGQSVFKALLSLVKPKADYTFRGRRSMQLTPFGPMAMYGGEDCTEDQNSPFLTREVWDAFVSEKVLLLERAFETVAYAGDWDTWIRAWRKELDDAELKAKGQQQASKENTNG